MPNTIAFTSGALVKPLLATFNSETSLIENINKQYGDNFAKSGAKVGDTVYANQPSVPTIGSGATAVAQDFIETLVPVTLTAQNHALFNFTSVEDTLELDDKFDRMVRPSMESLASTVEAAGLELLCANTANCAVSATATAPVIKDILGIGAKLSKFDAPVSDRFLMLDPLDEVSLVASVATQFNPADALSETYRKGSIGEAAGQLWSRSNRLPVLTIGSDIAGTVAGNYVQGAGTIDLAGFAANQWLYAGTVFSVVARLAVQPQTKATLGFTKQIVVTESVQCDGAGAATAKIAPLYATTALKNISALPVNGDVVNLVGTAGKSYRQILVYHRDAATFVTADLQKLPSIDTASETMNGIRARFGMGGDLTNDLGLYRFDILSGWSMLKKDWCSKLLVEV